MVDGAGDAWQTPGHGADITRPAAGRRRRCGEGVTGSAAAARAVGLLFLANGLAMSLLPRLPQVKDAVGADAGAFGLALLGTGVGGMVGAVATPRLLGRIGARRAATIAAVALAGATTLVGVAGSVPALFVALAAMGLADGVADVGQNHLMFEVQRTTPRSLTSRMHAVWSVGALAGTGIGTMAAAAGVAVVVHLVGVAGVVVVLVGAAGWTLRRSGLARVTKSPPTGTPIPRVPGPGVRSRRRWALVVVAGVAAAMIEGIAGEWSALTIRDGLGGGRAMAGAGPTVFAGAMLVGRVVGDRAIDRFGRAPTARAGAWTVALGGGVGLAAAAWSSQPGWLLAGLAIAGMATATLFPSMLAAGDRLDAGGTGVAVASFAARIGFLVVPVAVGGLAEATSLTTAFALLPAVGVLTALALPSALGPTDPAELRRPARPAPGTSR